MTTAQQASRLLRAIAKAGALSLALVFGQAAAVTPSMAQTPATQPAAPGRTIRLTGEVNTASAVEVIDKLRALSAADPSAEIILRVDSTGGDVNQGLAIIDVMNSIPNDIRTVCEGEADSMGAFIVTMGTPGKREALPNCELMYHQISGGGTGKQTDININANWGNGQMERIATLLAERTGWSKDIIRQLIEHDQYLTPQEAKTMGFIDTILPPVKGPYPPPEHAIPPGFCKGDGKYSLLCQSRGPR